MTVTAADLLLELRALRADGAPAYERHDAQARWFRQAMAEGNPPDRLRRDAPTWSERFDAQVLEGLDGCLIWDGPTEVQGAGRVPVIRKGKKGRRNARTFAMLRAGRHVPSHRRVIPTCGNNRCVNAAHLEVEKRHWAKSWTREKMIQRVQVVALQLGHTPNSRAWDAGKYKPVRETILTEFDGWDDFVAAAGLPPALRVRKGNQYTNVNWERECREGVRALARHLNRRPFITDVMRERAWLKEHGHPSTRRTYVVHLGDGRTWGSVLEKAGL